MDANDPSNVIQLAPDGGPAQTADTSRKRPKRAAHYLTIKDVMARWQCSYDFVYHLARRCEIESMRVGRSYRFTPDAVARAEAARTVKAR